MFGDALNQEVEMMDTWRAGPICARSDGRGRITGGGQVYAVPTATLPTTIAGGLPALEPPLSPRFAQIGGNVLGMESSVS